MFSKSGNPDQTPHCAVSDMGVHCLSVTSLGVSRLQWLVKYFDKNVRNSVSGSVLFDVYWIPIGVVGWCEGGVYLTLPERPNDFGLQLGKSCYPCSR